ncbi:MAG: hypothetical protein IJW67_05560 [Blautia sp.]|nr:hypothetical protein [Blautia sp.]
MCVDLNKDIVGYMPMPPCFPYKATFLHGRPLHKKYDDFWLRHPPMDPGHRAKIFAPFAALKGFEECIGSKEILYTGRRQLSEEEQSALNRKLYFLHSLTRNGKTSRLNRPFAKVTYFKSCSDIYNEAYGNGGQYITIEGTVTQVDPVLSKSIAIDNVEIAFEDICDIQCACDALDFP